MRGKLLVLAILATAARCSLAGDRGDPVSEPGLAGRKDILYFLDFNNESRAKRWFRNRDGYGWTGAKENVFFGGGALEVQQTQGTHYPMEIHPRIEQTDVAHVRWYRKWEAGYDWTQHKMPGVYARSAGRSGGSAGVKPTGRDKFSCKLFIDFRGFPHFYSYKPDQSGRYGWSPGTNIGASAKMVPERWYCFEMMIKANDPPAKDGELKMWIDGRPVAHYKDLYYRDIKALRINQFTYSAYVGGTWTSKRNQKLWDDQIVVARSYIGPMKLEPPKPKRTEPVVRVHEPKISPEEARRARDEKEAGRLLQMARRADRMGQRAVARSLYRQIVEKYPGTQTAAKAKEKLE